MEEDTHSRSAARINLSQIQARDIILAETYITAPEASGVWIGVPPMPPHFVGREALVADLIECLTSSENSALSAEGLPGVGKTALAIALAHHREVLHHFKDGVLWAGLGRQADVMNALAAWAEALQVDVSKLSDETARRQALRNAIGQRNFLLVIDDVWDNKAAQMLRCGGPNCCHLLTTRDKGIARAFSGAGHYRNVPPLADASAFVLLQKMAPEACEADPKAARLLAEAVGGLPLALELLGGYLSVPERALFPDLSQTALVAMTDPQRRLQLAAQRLGAPGPEKTTLHQIIMLSLEGLRESEKGIAAERAFYALGAFAPKPETFSQEAAETIAATDISVLALLASRNLVEIVSERLAIHRVLADVAYTRLEEQDQIRHCNYYVDFVIRNPNNWFLIEREYPQIRWMWLKTPDSKMLFYFVWILHDFHIRRGLWREQIAWCLRALQVCRQQDNLEMVASLLNTIGAAYHRLGQSSEAWSFLEQSISLSRSIQDASILVAALTNLCNVYIDWDQPQRAYECINEAIQISFEAPDDYDTANLLNSLARVQVISGQLKDALTLYNKALSVAQNTTNKVTASTLLSNLSSLYQRSNRLDKAESTGLQALALAQELNDKQLEANSLHNLGVLYFAKRKPVLAISYLEESLCLREEIQDSRGMRNTLFMIGTVFLAENDFHKALQLLERGYEIGQQIGFSSVDSIHGEAAYLSQIGKAYEKLDHPQIALQHLTKAIKLLNGSDNYQILKGIHDVTASVYLSLHNIDKSLDHLQFCLEYARLSNDRESEANCLVQLAHVTFYEKRQVSKAISYYEQALAAITESEIYDEAYVYSFMALAYSRLDSLQEIKLKDGIKHLQRAVQFLEPMGYPFIVQVKQTLAEYKKKFSETNGMCQ